MSAHPSILLVEDEVNVAMTLSERLRREGYRVLHAETKQQASDLTLANQFDLALLDVGLADGNGFEIGAEIRRTQPHCALIFLTAFGNPEDRVRGLELGADDYVVKPFHLRELLLRVQNVLRRVLAIHDEPATITLGRAELDLSRFAIRVDNTEHSLSNKECALMRFLLLKRGKVVSRDEILNNVWADDEFPTPRTVDNFIVKFRRFIEDDPNNPHLIRSIRGVGYQLVE